MMSETPIKETNHLGILNPELLSPQQINLLEKLDSLNLDCIKIKLMDKEEGKGWSREEADRLEIYYKRFLYMTYSRDEPIVPTKDIDSFWHQHILDTEKYAEDCEKVFGFFIHHFPYFGMRGEEDAKNLKSAFEKTIEIFFEFFNEEYSFQESSRCQSRCANTCSAQCAGSCNKQKKSHLTSNVRPSFEKEIQEMV